MDEAPPAKATFPRIFWIALGLELLERLAFYGVYVNLAVYLTETVGLSDVESGSLLGIFALVRAWVPVGTGALADRIGFRKSLTIAFVLYTFAYILLFLSPSRVGAYGAVMGMAIGGAFLKPVIPGTVRRYSAPDQRAMGFSFFYASVNLGSVVGKVATKLVRERLSLRSSMINAVIACLIGLGVTLALFHEPKKEAPALKVEASGAPDEVKKIELKEAEPERESDFLRDVLEAFTKPKLVVFLLLISGYYLLIEQFYQTFPTYIVRAFGEKAPREYITLINPAAIALLQVGVGRITKKLPAGPAMAFGVLVASGSMLLMGAIPTLAGACGSFFVFAIAEMILSPRYYEYVSSFAPKGREGLYMGIAIAPLGVGGLVGGLLSGKLIALHLPKGGPLNPFAVWGTYSAIGLACAVMLGIYAFTMGAQRPPETSDAKAS